MQPNIIGGKYRGKKIPVLDAIGLRPTGSRVRETLFNWLQRDIHGLSTLDLFAGSGLLSFEALSRGAKESTLIEKNKKAFQLLKKNAVYFKNEHFIFHHTDALGFIKKNDLTTYQLVFIDPPFEQNLHQDILDALNTKLAKGTFIYVESPKVIEMLPASIALLKQKKMGQVFFALYKVI